MLFLPVKHVFHFIQLAKAEYVCAAEIDNATDKHTADNLQQHIGYKIICQMNCTEHGHAKGKYRQQVSHLHEYPTFINLPV